MSELRSIVGYYIMHTCDMILFSPTSMLRLYELSLNWYVIRISLDSVESVIRLNRHTVYNKGVLRNKMILGRSDQSPGPPQSKSYNHKVSWGGGGWLWMMAPDVLRDWDHDNKITIESFCGKDNYYDWFVVSVFINFERPRPSQLPTMKTIPAIL